MTLTCPQTCCCCCCCCCCCWCGDDYEWPRCFRVRHAGTYDSDLTITINLHCIASETYDPSTPIPIYPIFVLNVFLQTRQGACCADWRKRVTWSVGKISQHVVLRLLLPLLQCTWWESAYFTFCARALFARVCCRLYNSNWLFIVYLHCIRIQRIYVRYDDLADNLHYIQLQFGVEPSEDSWRSKRDIFS